MRNHSHQNTPPRVPDSAPESARQGQGNAPIGLLTALLLVPGLVVTHDARAVGETTRVSVSSAGAQGNGISFGLVNLSADGRFVAFGSSASNLVPGDTNGVGDIFVYDRKTRHTTRVSVDSAGTQGNGDSHYPLISANGRFVAFRSDASNLVSGDTNGVGDIFVHDRYTHQTTRVSVDSTGTQGNAASAYYNAISANGRFVAFESDASNLVPGDTNGARDIFVRDQYTHQTTRVSVDSAGNQGIDSPGLPTPDSGTPAISADGRFVAFNSGAGDLVPDDTNAGYDVFVHDRHTHQTTRVSVDSAGNQQVGDSYFPVISADGRVVAFNSSANNLVPTDTNDANDVFVHDRLTHQTNRVSVDSAGNQQNGHSAADALGLSADGRFVAFFSFADNLVPGDTNDAFDAFVHDRQTHQTTRVNVDSAGIQGNSGSYVPTISSDGRFVAFASSASNLVLGDTNGQWDIFVHDRLLDRSATADLGVTQTADPAQFVPLSPLTYTLTAVNHGPDTATDVTVNDRPALMSGTVLSVTPSQGSCSQGAPFVCYLGTLAPGASSTITVNLQPRWRGTVSLWNTAQVSAAPVDGNLPNNQSTLRTDVAP